MLADFFSILLMPLCKWGSYVYHDARTREEPVPWEENA